MLGNILLLLISNTEYSMSVKTKLLIPLILFTILIIGVVITWEKSISEVREYQSNLITTTDFFHNVLAVRVELDQYLLTESRSDRIDFNQKTRALLAESDSLNQELDIADELVDDISESVQLYINELDEFLLMHLDIDSTLLVINNAGDELSMQVLSSSDNLKSRDSLFIYTDDSPEYINSYQKAREQSYQLLANVVQLKSDVREFIITKDTSYYESVLMDGERIKSLVHESTKNQYLSVDKANFLSSLATILDTTQDYAEYVSENERISKNLSLIQSNIENYLTDISFLINTRLTEVLNKRRTYSLIIYALSILILVVMVFQLVKVISKPLNKLKKAMIGIANEEKNIEEYRIKSGDNFGEISNTLHEMYAKARSREEDLINSNQKLSVANRELEAFAYSVSHDLRTPLRSISGFSQALLANYEDQLDDTGKHYLNRLGKASQKMGVLIDDILKLSRISRSDISRNDLFINDLAEDIFQNISDDLNLENKAELVIKGKIRVNADEGLLIAVLQNLIGNAIKFSSKNTKPVVTIKQLTRDNKQYVCITDNGVGFNMKYVHKLFQPFQRLHTDSEFEGTGIGLATVKRIINKHNGEIFVESELGEGTSFYFNFGEQ